MRTPPLAVLFAAVLLGCDKKPTTDDTVDTDIIADTEPAADTDITADCDPFADEGSQGCRVGEKCTWVRTAEEPERTGTLDCVPNGTVALGDACQRGLVGATTGFDNCVAGNICVDSVCKDICGFERNDPNPCAPYFACTRYNGLFLDADGESIAGACSATCNPLTQTLDSGGTCPPQMGCYVLNSSTLGSYAVCATAGTATHGQAISNASPNACAPGHMPRRPTTDATTWECGALCQPNDVTSTTNQSDEGGVAPYSCESAGAEPPGHATEGESCRYYWARQPSTIPSPISKTLGFCFKHAAFQYDSDGDQTPDAPFPRCTTLTTGDVVPPISNPTGNDALEFWCIARPMGSVPGVLSGGRP